jgi:hypothetical protein
MLDGARYTPHFDVDAFDGVEKVDDDVPGKCSFMEGS